MARHEGPDLTAFKDMGFIHLDQPTRLPCGHRSWVSTEDGKMCVECYIQEQRLAWDAISLPRSHSQS